jgi:two-component system alkaline phosphatase synthesis response regulator PhoP
MKTVLVVEDDPRIAQIVRDYLQHAGFSVLIAGDGAGALALALDRRPDLVVLDPGLPGLDGIQVAKGLRRESQVPLIMLTARVEESDRLLGLDVGADDYITKPFSPRELVARVRAVLRRTDSSGATGVDGEVLRRGDLVIDTGRMIVTRAGRTLDLTATEFELAAAALWLFRALMFEAQKIAKMRAMIAAAGQGAMTDGALAEQIGRLSGVVEQAEGLIAAMQAALRNVDSVSPRRRAMSAPAIWGEQNEVLREIFQSNLDLRRAIVTEQQANR